MSHFSGLVVMTPNYAKEHGFEDALAPYSEHIKVDKYCYEEVSEFDKCNFLSTTKGLSMSVLVQLRKDLETRGVKTRFDPITIYKYKSEFVEAFKKLYPEVYDDFEIIYKEFGYNWNGNTWELNEKSGKWEKMSTRNPKTKYDYYIQEYWWFKSTITKEVEFAKLCELGDIDFNGDESERCELSYKNLPTALIIDGEWYEWGEVGWFGSMSGDKSYEDWASEVTDLLKDLPSSSECYMMNFHI